jgi:fatty acid synthase subunit alpha
MNTGIVPGNRNGDNVDPQLEQFDYIAFINKAIQTNEVKAATVFSFGFGQKGTQAIVVHPKYLFASLSEEQYEGYQAMTMKRRRVATADFQRRMLNEKVFVAKGVAPYTSKEESDALVDPGYRMKVPV